jgi:hypothetical protein
MKGKFIQSTLAWLIITTGFLVNTANAGVIYSNDFESGVAEGFSNFTGVAEAPNGESYIGHLIFGDTSLLTLDNLSSASLITIDFDVYGLRSLDGIDNGDNFEFFVNGESLFVDYYGHSDGVLVGPSTGELVSHDDDTFGHGYFYGGASTYHYSVSFLNTNDTVSFGFKANTNQGWPDESFGIDNVVVTSVPEPSTLAILALAVLGLASRKVKK